MKKLNFLYHIFYQFLKAILNLRGFSCWARNSFALKRFVFGLSDIDLTLRFDEKLSKQEVVEQLDVYTEILKYFFLVKETNIYWKESLYLRFGNFFELARDEKLLEEAKFYPKKEDLVAQAVVFLMRMCEADYENLFIKKKDRTLKWQGHFNDLGIYLSKIDSFKYVGPNSIFDLISKLSDNEITLNENYFDANKVHENFKERKFRVLFATSWISSIYGESHFNLLKEDVNECSVLMRKLYFYQICWEVFGVSTQTYFLNKNNVDAHFNLLSKFVSWVEDDSRNISRSIREISMKGLL